MAERMTPKEPWWNKRVKITPLVFLVFVTMPIWVNALYRMIMGQ